MPPTNFKLGDPPTYYDIATNATFDGQVTICLSYPEAAFEADSSPRLYHYTMDQWFDVTTSVNATTRLICGAVSSMSPFALGSATTTTGTLVVQSLLAVNPRQGNAKMRNGWWLFAGLINTDSAPSSTFVLESIDTTGVALTLQDPQGVLDAAVFADQDCRQKGSKTKASVVCCITSRAWPTGKSCVEFKQKKPAGGTWIRVDGKFWRRSLNVTGSLTARGPFEIGVAMPAGLGALTSSPLRCKASPSKLRCKAY